MLLQEKINQLYDKKGDFSDEDHHLFEQFKRELNAGRIRAATKLDSYWQTNVWVKKGILIGFRMGKTVPIKWSDKKVFFDKDTFPEKDYNTIERFRIVPGGSSVRDGSYIGKGVTIMPPAFVNVGAYVDDGTMIDSHALVGSCAQIGKNVHLSAAAMVGGVIEPIGSNPVIIEDDAFIGGNCGIYEGVIIGEKAIIAAGVILTASTKVYDMVNETFIKLTPGRPLKIPANAVVISGSRTVSSEHGIAIYCPVIVKYRDDKTERSVKLEEMLRK